jgi:mannosyltransferase OCH1-like enzyme
LNPGYVLRYFNLVDARRYLAAYFHPTFLRTFDCIEAFAGKSDFFRIALLYRDGGHHSDWKQACLEPGVLDEISATTDFFAAIDLGFSYARATRSCAANAFVGSVPRHPIAARYLDLAMRNVQASSYPENTLLATGPCLFGNAIRIIDPTFGRAENVTKFGTYKNNHFYYRNRTIIQHKCCGDHLLPGYYGQDWDGGNNYNILFNEKRYYCQDSMMIFEN